MKKKTEAKDSRPVWKRGKDWIQFSPPRNHPTHEEWRKIVDRSKDNTVPDRSR